jgi:hypothetical protein
MKRSESAVTVMMKVTLLVLAVVVQEVVMVVMVMMVVLLSPMGHQLKCGRRGRPSWKNNTVYLAV